jgi:hypothetical protein
MAFKFSFLLLLMTGLKPLYFIRTSLAVPAATDAGAIDYDPAPRAGGRALCPYGTPQCSGFGQIPSTSASISASASSSLT